MRKLIFILLGICFSLNIIAQKGTIRGFVYEKESGEPVMFCNVTLNGTTYGSQTDINGMYNLSQIPVGEYTISVTFIGYQKLEKKITLKEIIAVYEQNNLRNAEHLINSGPK